MGTVPKLQNILFFYIFHNLVYLHEKLINLDFQSVWGYSMQTYTSVHLKKSLWLQIKNWFAFAPCCCFRSPSRALSEFLFWPVVNCYWWGDTKNLVQYQYHIYLLDGQNLEDRPTKKRRKRNCLSLPVGMQNGMATLEDDFFQN